ncbi:MAG: CRISPR-associated ring nuclease Csm6 [Casimicrobiaceae bacterium]|nr:CRISPR-associated ring nuclease Csm6 [Casimicrobiaceae bacterium]MDW8312671.1 CRISPR-associated ring nuclease Csm6 [Burkholderiales bacterium]
MKRILLCVTGLSPQIVTETVYALATRESPWIPNEVHLVTTAKGAENARLLLLSEDPGWFFRLCADYRLPPIRFDASLIHVINDAEGKPLADIKNDADNAAAADTIARVVRQLTMESDTEVHASIAGGRKTMGYLLGAAMSLYGRTADRLSHVLVSSPYESHAGFFYPTPQPRVITAQGSSGEALDCSKARVWLGDIPFVRLRSLLRRDLVERDLSYASLVELANRDLLGEKWVLWPDEGVLQVGEQYLTISRREAGLLMLLAACRRLGRGIRAPLKGMLDPEWADEAKEALANTFGLLKVPDEFMSWLSGQNPNLEASFLQMVSRLEKRLINQLGLVRDPFERRAQGARGQQRAYMLAVPADQFQIRQDLDAAIRRGLRARRRTGARTPEPRSASAQG